MGTGKGSMDYWAARVPVSRVILELKGEIHEQIVRDAFRVAAAKLPGAYPTVPARLRLFLLTPACDRQLRDHQEGRRALHRRHQAHPG
jgi:hypothetical protein